MLGIIIFNVLAIALAVGVGAGIVSSTRVGSMLGWLHSIIGITPPAPAQNRVFAIVWIGSIIVMVDGLLAFLVFLTRHLM